MNGLRKRLSLHKYCIIICLASIILTTTFMYLWHQTAIRYNQIVHEVNERSFGASVFVTPADEAVGKKVMNLTHGWSNSSDWNELFDDVWKMLNWVHSFVSSNRDTLYPIIPEVIWRNVEYVQDSTQFPAETIKLERGDCEDQAVLLCSMILSYLGNESQVAFIECIVQSDIERAHVGVQMVFEDGIVLLDPVSGYYTNDSGKIVLKEVELEVQKWVGFSYQYGMDTDKIYIQRAFSHDMERRFDSTEEYLSWMQTRFSE